MPLVACCSVSGNVHTTAGAPIAAARVDVHRSGVSAAVSDRNGDFVIDAPPGTYELETSQRGFTTATVTVRVVDRRVVVSIALAADDAPTLRQVGSVTVDGRLEPIRGALPATTISRADLDALGDDRIADGLALLPGITFARPNGGASSGITAVALRGPDPSESLIALDGQVLNDGNTGDLDVSRLPVAAFSAIDVTEGLGPEDTSGSNTFGGAINLVSLQPTRVAHQAFSVSGGSFGQSELWFNATGTHGRFGYATALDDQNELGYVRTVAPLYSSTDAACAPCATPLGSAVAAHTLLAAATWSFSQLADVTARTFVLGDYRDESASLSGIDENVADVGLPQYGKLVGPGEQTFAQTLRAYQVRGRAPLGSGELAASLATSDDGVSAAGGATSPYDLTHRDRRDDVALSWQRSTATSQFTIGGYSRYETLGFEAPPIDALVAETIRVLYARGGFSPVAHLRLDGGVFASRYTTFGANLDGRLGAIYDVEPTTSIRLSIGTGFRAPLLAERYEFAYSQLALDGNNVFVGQGSPNELPEHATEYEFGFSHEFARAATLDVSFYETNLRNPVEVFYPLAAVAAGTCATNSYAAPNPACVSSQGNVGSAVYTGTEVRYAHRFAAEHLLATARYGLNVAYPRNLSASFSNPTSGGNLVNGEQFLGVPQQQGSLQIDWENRGSHAAAAAFARGNNNELGAGPFVVIDASVGHHFGDADLSLAGTNLLNGVAGRFTRFGAGRPYRGTSGPLPTDALAVEPAGARLTVTIRH